MSFPDRQITANLCGMLPQFAELREVANPSRTIASTMEIINGGNVQSEAAQNRSVYTIAGSSGQKQPQPETEVQSVSKYLPTALPIWSEKLLLRENVQINVPSFSQNNPVLDMQQSGLQTQFVFSNACLPQASTVMQGLSMLAKEQKESDMQLRQRMAAQYFQKLQATSLPRVLQHIIKQVKKENEEEEEKMEHIQNNILNIPNISRNVPPQNNSGYPSSELMLGIQSDVSLETDQQENLHEGNFQPVLKVEQQVQTDSPRPEKRMRFRAKIGEIKISVSNDGIVLYCCPECNTRLPDKTNIEQHVQMHLQERKYECKVCGAMLKRKEHLDQHMRGHSNDRPFKCTVCQKGFKRNEHLTRHHVIHSGDKNFLCNKCHKAFSRKDHLNKHMQTHSGIRKGKMKEDSYYVEKDKQLTRSGVIDITMIPKQEMAYATEDNLPKQEVTLLHHIQSLQKNQELLQTFNALKEQAMKDANQSQQEENINMNDILSANMRYLMPS